MKQMALPLSPLPPPLDDRISPSRPLQAGFPRSPTARPCCNDRSGGLPLPAPVFQQPLQPCSSQPGKPVDNSVGKSGPPPVALLPSEDAPRATGAIPSSSRSTSVPQRAPASPAVCDERELSMARSKTETPAETLARLRAVIQRIEGGGTRFKTVGDPGFPSTEGAALQSGWRLGDDAIDRRFSAGGLAIGGVHEIKPLVFGHEPASAAWSECEGGSQASSHGERRGNRDRGMGSSAFSGAVAGAAASALAFALRLAVRRGVCGGAAIADRPVLFCSTREDEFENGALYGPGLLPLGLDVSRLINVRVRRQDEALWAIEEALHSGAVSAVVARLDGVALTPARRLSLAAQDGGTPCLVVSRHDSPGMAASVSRLRVGPIHGLTNWPANWSANWSADRPAHQDGNPKASCHPGQMLQSRQGQRGEVHLTARRGLCGGLYRLRIERCRPHLTGGPSPPFVVEWSDETHCFRVVSPLADGAAETGSTRRRAGR